MERNLSSTYRYLGVKDYGCDWMNKENISNFQYRFENNGEEWVFSIESGRMRMVVSVILFRIS